jgi:hypothetical protein
VGRDLAIEGEAQFRKWLVRQLSQTKFAIRREDSDATIAARLGVHVSVVREARELHQARHPDSPLGAVLRGSRARRWVYLEPPEDIYLEWQATLERLGGLASTTLLRSAVHWIMQTKTQPAWVSLRKSAWPWKGRWLKQVTERRHRLKVDMNDALYVALERRALATKTWQASIVRWAMLMTLWQKTPGLKIVPGFAGLFNKPEQYCLNPKVEN